MTWSLRDFRQESSSVEHPPPPAAPAWNDDEPLPTFAGDMSDDYYDREDEPVTTPAWMEKDLEQQGLWSQAKLDAFARLQTRGIQPTHEDPNAPAWGSGHEPPRAPTPVLQATEADGFWAWLRRCGGARPEAAPLDPGPEQAQPAFRSAHELPFPGRTP